MEDWTNYYMNVVLSLPRLYLFLWVYLDVYIYLFSSSISVLAR